jgi:hypothetical protein
MFVEYYNYMSNENNNLISKKAYLALVALKKHRKIKLLFIDRHIQSAIDAKYYFREHLRYFQRADPSLIVAPLYILIVHVLIHLIN